MPDNQPSSLPVTVLAGDALERLRELPDDSVDAVVTDPPYGLAPLPTKKVAEALTHWLTDDRAFIPGGRGFMGASWDRFVPPPALWDEVFRVLKPGGYLASFAAARTQDLMGMSIRLAGFQVKDELAAWLRADSFAKSKSSLASGYEPVLLAFKPGPGGASGSLNVDDCRTPFASAADEAESKTKNQHGKFGTRHGGNEVFGDFGDAVRTDYDAPGRWPKNVLLSEDVARELDEANPASASYRGKPRQAAAGDGWRMSASGSEYEDRGGPSRFFPRFDVEPAGFYAGRATAAERPVGPDGTKHSTVKPLSVMRWLARLITPAGGTVLDPFLGSGTTAEAAVLEGLRFIGIEREQKFLPLIDQRVERVGSTVVRELAA